MKLNISDLIVNEISKYQELLIKGTTRANTSGEWFSVSSSTAYSYTNETDLMNQLKIALADYLVSADDWNDFYDEKSQRDSEESVRISQENTRISNENARIATYNNFAHKGAYSSLTTYYPFNIVTHVGSQYMCILETTNNVPTNATYWILMSTGVNSNLTPRGTYSAGTTYALYDLVVYNSNFYVAKSSTTGNLPTNATYWDLYLDMSTPTYSTSAESTSQITSIPDTAVKGELEAVLSGNSVVNILPNSLASCEVTTGWTALDCAVSTDNSNELEGTNCIKITNSATTGIARYDITSLISTGKYYLISAYVKNGNLSTGIKIKFNTDDTDVESSSISATSYNRVGVVIQPTDFDLATYKYLELHNVGANTQYSYFDAIMLQEITSTEYALGATALLDKYPWHNDLQHTNMQRVKSVGKNLLPTAYGSVTQNGITVTTNPVNGEITVSGTASADTRITLYGLLRYGASGSALAIEGSPVVRKNTNISISYSDTSGSRSGTARLALTGVGGAMANTGGANLVLGTGYNNLGLDIDANTVYLYALSGASFTNYKFRLQIEYGSIATTYEEYTETTAIVPVTLRSVSSTVKDTFDCNVGVHTKNVQEYTLTESDITALGTALTNYDKVVISKSNLTGIITAPSGLTQQTLLIPGFSPNPNITTVDIDTTAQVNTYINTSSFNASIILCITKGKYADLATAKTALAGTKIVYQLATPTVTNYWSNVVNAEPSGTVIVEPFIEDVGLYATNIAIANTSYPISSLTHVNKIDTSTGALTPISLSSCTVAAGGLTFTISGASAGEYYEYGYTYVALSTKGTLAYSYATNLKAQVNSNSEQLKDLDIKVERIIDIESSRINVANTILNTINATTSFCVFIAPSNCVLNKVQIVNGSNITKNNTDYWTITLIDKGSSGGDSNTIASLNTTVTSGSAFVAYDALSMGTLDATHRILNAGDVVLLTFTKTASATSFAEAFASIEYMNI